MTDCDLGAACDYVELHARSAFSFLRASSLPEDLAHAAAASGHRIFGLADVGGLYGIPRFHAIARRQGLRPLVGAELDVEGGGRVALLCEDRGGYKNLCRLLTLGHARAWKDACRVTPAQLADLRLGLVALSAGTPRHLVLLAEHLGTERLFAEVQRHMDPSQERENRRRIDAARARGLRVVASGGVRHASPEGKPLFDALTCIRLKTTLDAAGRHLSRNAERHVRPPRQIAAIFRDLPEAVRLTREIADRCAYTLDDLGYELPEPQFLHAASLDGELWHRTMDGARRRYGGAGSARWPKAIAQLERELALIAKLGLAGYFLIVHDMVLFCGRESVLVQGRGSAANSAVCYALGITAVDPVQMNLLFERFLSEERTDSTGHKAWPDIDLDLPSGDQREKVIQHGYQRYGSSGAAMTANVITYRARSASREIGKVLGLPEEELDRLSKLLPHFEFTTDSDSLQNRAREAGLAVGDRRVGLYLQLCRQIAGLPRHLGQHSGGMNIARARLDARQDGGAVGQGRLRRPGDHQDRPARVGHDGGARAGDSAGARPRRRRAGPGAASARRSRRLPAAADRRHRRRLPGRIARADGDLAAHAAGPFLRHRGGGRDHPPRPHRRADGQSVPGTARGTREALGAASFALAGARADPGRSPLPGAADADRDDRREFHRGRGGRAAPRDGQQAQRGADEAHRAAAAGGDDGQWDHAQGAGRDRPEHHLVRAVRISREPCRVVRADRVRERISQGAPPARVLRGDAQLLADGLLQPGHAGEGRAASGSAGPAHRRGPQRLAVHAGTDGSRRGAAAAARVAVRARAAGSGGEEDRRGAGAGAVRQHRGSRGTGGAAAGRAVGAGGDRRAGVGAGAGRRRVSHPPGGALAGGGGVAAWVRPVRAGGAAGGRSADVRPGG